MSNEAKTLDHVNYDALDRAKNAFIEAGRKTLRFAESYGFIPDERMGASANVFALDLKPFLKSGAENLYVTLLPEGLGTADDARPKDLSPDELRRFWHNIAYKTLSCITNDAASSGMQPILISLYLPSASPEEVFTDAFMDGFLGGFVEGCKKVGCVYFSGETPQLKNKIYPDKLDVAGALFGIMPPGRKPVDGSELGAGNRMVFIESSGPHENGFTSLRKLAEELPDGYRTKLPSGKEYWEAINAPSHLYTPLVRDILEAGIEPTNIEPISGHGWQKLMRGKTPLAYVIHETLPVPEIFSFIQEASNTPQKEMIKIFNYGLGLAIFVRDDESAHQTVKLASKHGLNAVVGGEVKASEKREVVIEPFDITLESDAFLLGHG